MRLRETQNTRGDLKKETTDNQGIKLVSTVGVDLSS